MKTNGNDKRVGNYYIGLDCGTSSVGWAATDSEYNILKFKGNAMWGVHLFEEANDASERRSSRASRRRLNRRKQRLEILEVLFSDELNKKDPLFLTILAESELWTDDKRTNCKFSLFNDPEFTDKDYYRTYPTIYHLRKELLESTEKHDIRLVYLALHHIMKSRGHFLYDTADNADEIKTVAAAFEELAFYISENYALTFEPTDKAGYINTLVKNDLGITRKKKLLRELLGYKDEAEASLRLCALSDLLSGASVKLAELFDDDELKTAEKNSVSLKDSLDDSFDALSAVLGERIGLLLQSKTLFDTARLSQILNGRAYISDAKVALFDKNGSDLRILKRYVRKTVPEKYKHIFSEKKDKLNNFAAYSRYSLESGEYSCTQADFCKFLRSELPKCSDSEGEIARIFREIQEDSFLTKLKGSDNGVIPYQLQRRELVKILQNASTYLPFLLEKDIDGFSVADKILKTFEFRIPYYVGPLNPAAGHFWAVRFAGKENEKVYPWKFDEIIDTESSAEGFIENLIGKCNYTGEKVLPKDSLLYSEYTLLNELNMLRVNDRPLTATVKNQLIDDLFRSTAKKVTKKSIHSYLRSKGLIEPTDVISGIDDTVKSNLRSFRDFRSVLEKTGDVSMVESIIRAILVFGDDKRMLRRWLAKNTYGIDEDDIKHICRLKYSDWGRLSEAFLTGIYSEVDGRKQCIMDCLREYPVNLMQLLSKEYSFASDAEKYRDEHFGNNISLSDRLDEMYIAPAVRRSIRRTLRIVDEIVDVEKAAPAKIFIEMARDSSKDMKGKRTESRKSKLLDLYKSCKAESGELFAALEKEDDNSLRSDKLYLYYTQLGKCMYSGERIDFPALARGELYDIDHIYPRSKIKDNSLDNRVLVKNTLNREKTDIYPIDEKTRRNMLSFWTMLKKQGLISEKKYERLIRSTPLTDAELSSFVARQLTETQQSTKALASLLKESYGENTRIVYSKAGNVSDFRHDFDMVKCREVNDLHHAKDAYLNIVVGNVYNTRFTDRFFNNILNEKYSLNRVFEFDTKGAWKCNESIVSVKKWMAKNNVLVTRMPCEVKGALFDLQLKPAGKGQLEKKVGLDIEKYGGYNKLTGTYYFVVESTVKKKRVCTLEPVLLYKKALYESSPIDYCEQLLGMTDPVIIAGKIPSGAMLELNGCRLIGPTGRTGNSFIYMHTYQLAIGYAQEKYIKAVKKYVDRCHAQNKELPITEHDGLTIDNNIALYNTLLEKCTAKVYSSCFGEFDKLHGELKKFRKQFSEMSCCEQAEILLSIINSFSCNTVYTNLEKLGGVKTRGRILVNGNLSNLKSAYLINQSVTGLFETRVDLLGKVSK